jgi:hypothetical protein
MRGEEVRRNWYCANAMSVGAFVRRSASRDDVERGNPIFRPHLVISPPPPPPVGLPVMAQSCRVVLLRKHRIHAGIFR